MKNIALLLVATLVLGSCHRYWRNADRFQAELKCGQTAEEIRLTIEPGEVRRLPWPPFRARPPTRWDGADATSPN